MHCTKMSVSIGVFFYHSPEPLNLSFDPAEAIEKLFDFLFRAFLGLMAAASFIFHLQYLLVNTPKGYFDNIPLGGICQPVFCSFP